MSRGAYAMAGHHRMRLTCSIAHGWGMGRGGRQSRCGEMRIEVVRVFRAPGEKFRFARGRAPREPTRFVGGPVHPGDCGIAGPPASMEKTYRIRNKSYGKKRIGTRESACDYRVNNNKKIWENQVTACFGIIFD